MGRVARSIFYDVVMTNANENYALPLPVGTRSVNIQCRDATDILVLLVDAAPDDATNPYRTIKAGTSWDFICPDSLATQSLTFYLRCASAGKIAEVTMEVVAAS